MHHTSHVTVSGGSSWVLLHTWWASLDSHRPGAATLVASKACGKIIINRLQRPFIYCRSIPDRFQSFPQPLWLSWLLERMVKKLLDFSNPTTWAVWGENNSPSFSLDLSHLLGVMSWGYPSLEKCPFYATWASVAASGVPGRWVQVYQWMQISSVVWSPGFNEVHALHWVVMFV